MNPRQFLLIGGAVLIAVGILGFVGVIGPTAADSIFGDTWYFDNGENWAHTLLGVVAVVAGLAPAATWQRWLVILVGLLALFFAVYNLFTTTFLGAELQRPLDTLLHLVVGVAALFAAYYKGGAQPATT
ncbi:MAG TPA: hypothetical protein VGA97_03910 [Acidimicrobiia bacterium]